MRHQVKVVGVTFEGRQEALARLYDDWFTEGLEDDIVIALERDPENPHDQNAVKVMLVEPSELARDIGFVPRDQAGWVGKAIQDGRVSRVEVDGMGCSGRGAVWMSLSLDVADNDQERGQDDDTITGQDGRRYRFC